MRYSKYEKIRLRSEDFGGLVETAEGLFLLNHKEYAALTAFDEVTSVDAPMLHKFLKIGAVVCVNEN